MAITVRIKDARYIQYRKNQQQLFTLIINSKMLKQHFKVLFETKIPKKVYQY